MPMKVVWKFPPVHTPAAGLLTGASYMEHIIPAITTALAASEFLDLIQSAGYRVGVKPYTVWSQAT